MKKKVVFLVIILLLILGMCGFIFWNNMVTSVITLDINPSIKINLTRNDKVKSIVALNDDAKEIITNNLKGKTLNDTLKLITDNLVEKGYVENGNVAIILHSEGNIKNANIESILKEVFAEQEITIELIVIENITKEDEELAKKYDISPAKAAYISSIIEDNSNIEIEAIKDKSVSEIKETKERGVFCDKDYFLEGDWCYREVDRKPASSGKVCPKGYYEYKDKCYEETRPEETSKLVCSDEFKLQGDKCVRTTTVQAVATSYTCSQGEIKTKLEVGESVKGAGDANDPVCVDPSSKTRPVSPCKLPAGDSTERMSYGGKCYWHRAPVIAEGCPGKIQVNGACWDDASNVYVCPNSGKQRDKNDYCYTILKNVKPVASGYKCDDGMTLNGTKCIKEEIEDATYEKTCPSGYTLVDNDRCINISKTSNKENGLICDIENSRLRGNECIIYEMIEASK